MTQNYHSILTTMPRNWPFFLHVPWTSDNELQLNLQVRILSTAKQLQSTTAFLSSVTIIWGSLPMRWRSLLTIDCHATSAPRACNYHIQATWHVCHLLMTELALSLAYSLVLSQLDYCNALLHGASVFRSYSTCRTLQCASFCTALDDQHCSSSIGSQFNSGFITIGHPGV